MSDIGQPHLRRRMILRAAFAGVGIVILSAVAMVMAIFHEIADVKDTYLAQGRQQIEIPEITRADAGGPRTIMILGSDERWQDTQDGTPGRSDTIMLIRVDPDKDAIATMSIPRDLKVTIPGTSRRDKINAAYAHGGPRLMVRTVKQLFFEATGKNFLINNVINVHFSGFRRAVNYIGGVYIDVDRDYFNDNSGPEKYATIDIDPGYQKLKGQDAPDYVRFRHGDNDLIRGHRQQDFLRQAKSQAGMKKLLDISKRDELIKRFGRYFQVDKTLLSSTKQMVALLKLAIYSRDKTIRQVRFRARDEDGSYVVASPQELQTTWNEFMHARGSKSPGHKQKPTSADLKFARKRNKHNKRAAVKGLEIARREGEDQAIVASSKIRFPFYYPVLRARGSAYAGKAPHIYTLKDETKKKQSAYRLVISKGVVGEYYGVQGMTWRNPPILDHPSETRTVNGRKLLLFYNGQHLRIVAWRTAKAVYWVTNTLTQGLSNSQMLGIAGSLRRLSK